MSVYIQPTSPMYQYGRGQPPFMPAISVGAQLQPFVPYFMTDLMNYITSNCQRSNLRMAAFNVCSTNNWNNQFFIDYFAFTLRLIERRAIEMNTSYEMAAQTVIQEAALLLCGVAYQAVANQIQFPPEEAQQAVGLLQDYQNAINRLNTPIMTNTTAYAAPNLGQGAAPMWVNNAVNTQPTTTGMFNNTTSATPSNLPVVEGWKKSFPEARQNPPEEVAVQPTPIQPANKGFDAFGWKVLEEDLPWVGSEEQRWPMLYNPRTHKRVTYINQQGQMRQELIEVEYNEHALQTPLTHAEFDRMKYEMMNGHVREVSQQEIEAQIVRATPSKSQLPELHHHYSDDGKLIFGIGKGLEAMAWYVRSSWFNQEPNENGQRPECFLVGWNDILADYDESGEAEEFLRRLGEAQNFADVVVTLSFFAKQEIAGLWNQVNALLTREFNYILKCRLGVGEIQITDLHEDYNDVMLLLEEQYGDTLVGKLLTRDAYYFDKLFQPLGDFKSAVYSQMNWGDDTDEAIGYFQGVMAASTVTHVKINSFDLEFQLEVGEAGTVAYGTSLKMRELVEDIMNHNGVKHAYAHYVQTLDGQVFRVCLGLLDKAKIVYYRVL